MKLDDTLIRIVNKAIVRSGRNEDPLLIDEQAVEQIIKALHEAGYKNSAEPERGATAVYRETSKQVQDTVGKEDALMTGKQWYDAFEKELKTLISRGDGETWMGWDCGEVRVAARKASGLATDE